MPGSATANTPSDEHVHAVLERIVRQVRRFLERRAEDGDADAATEDARVLEILARFQADAVTGAHARREGRLPGLDLEPPPPRKPRCADLHGFTLHAGVAVPAGDRQDLEHLCRYALRPPVATARLSRTPDGRVAYRLRRPFTDGTRSIVLTPLAFLARLAALIPPPRAHQITYSGVLAPAARLRARVVPEPEASPHPRASSPLPHECEVSPRAPAVDALVWPALDSPDEPAPARPRSPKRRRYAWAALLERVFAIDAIRCPHCGHDRKILAVITHAPTVRAILRCLGIDERAPPLGAPARAFPAQGELGFASSEDPVPDPHPDLAGESP